MGKYQWHVTIAGRNPTIVRHYNWITKLYKFIIRNPQMFKGNELTIYKNGEPMINLGYDTIISRKYLGLKEGVERKEMIRIAETIRKGQLLPEKDEGSSE